jgi:hypothetical protein
MKDDPIPDAHHVSRYCSPLRVENDLPSASAFEINPKHDYLSVNWLEYWGSQGFCAALDRIRDEFDPEVKEAGRFVVLNVSKVKSAIEAQTQRPSSITHQPTKTMDSHAGVFGYFLSDFEVAVELARIVRLENVFPAVSV